MANVQRNIKSDISRKENTVSLNVSARVKESYDVLLADDSEDDRFLMRTAIAKVPRLKIVAEVSNGTEVLAYFNELGSKTGAGLRVPDLLLLDLNMPFKDGFQVLEWLRTQPYDKLTVVVLTESIQPGHFKRALELGANYYHVKSRSNSGRHATALALEKYLMNASAPLLGSSKLEKF